ncbi:ComF family protein [Oscillochloris sp. ZM17-4]|uniref:ComF family protein n=1 Tax=Oscillochloris sp. ZM17-4 TaxID=2866714 RepID=UPI001C72EA64|nr:ComF family protein [Oscillochloris sp. ZM17-4]MBX0329365.1 ComF family protein [Oscillochloris sp. ZM17-4]
MIIRDLLDRLLDLLFPDRCLACGRAGALLCARCRSGLRPYPPEAPPDGLDGVAVACLYDSVVRKAIHRMKYGRMRRAAAPLGDLLADHLLANPQPADALMAVPLHAGRLAERGFNQSEELAARIARRSGLPLVPGLLRCRDTGHQASLGRRARRANIEAAFVWAVHAPPPARVLLVDDVLTTGATLAACADALRAAGTREVRAVAIARSLAPGQRSP